jgi:hypothetical protein
LLWRIWRNERDGGMMCAIRQKFRLAVNDFAGPRVTAIKMIVAGNPAAIMRLQLFDR